jgi:hypothetical protein
MEGRQAVPQLVERIKEPTATMSISYIEYIYIFIIIYIYIHTLVGDLKLRVVFVFCSIAFFY